MSDKPNYMPNNPEASSINHSTFKRPESSSPATKQRAEQVPSILLQTNPLELVSEKKPGKFVMNKAGRDRAHKIVDQIMYDDRWTESSYQAECLDLIFATTLPENPARQTLERSIRSRLQYEEGLQSLVRQLATSTPEEAHKLRQQLGLSPDTPLSQLKASAAKIAEYQSKYRKDLATRTAEKDDQVMTKIRANLDTLAQKTRETRHTLVKPETTPKPNVHKLSPRLRQAIGYSALIGGGLLLLGATAMSIEAAPHTQPEATPAPWQTPKPESTSTATNEPFTTSTSRKQETAAAATTTPTSEATKTYSDSRPAPSATETREATPTAEWGSQNWIEQHPLEARNVVNQVLDHPELLQIEIPGWFDKINNTEVGPQKITSWTTEQRIKAITQDHQIPLPDFNHIGLFRIPFGQNAQGEYFAPGNNFIPEVIIHNLEHTKNSDYWQENYVSLSLAQLLEKAEKNGKSAEIILESAGYKLTYTFETNMPYDPNNPEETFDQQLPKFFNQNANFDTIAPYLIVQTCGDTDRIEDNGMKIRQLGKFDLTQIQPITSSHSLNN